MRAKKALLSATLATMIGLSGTSLAKDNYNPEYHFDGDIGNTYIHFYEEDEGLKNVLEKEYTKESYGKDFKNKTVYIDKDDDFRLDQVIVVSYSKGDDGEWKEGFKMEYVDRDMFYMAFANFQSEFDGYLEKILMLKEGEK